MDMGGHDMGGMSPPAAGAAAMGGMKSMRYTHMTFFWGKNSEVLFTMWPGTRGGMYALALIFVFALAVIAEFLGSRRADACLAAGFLAFRAGLCGGPAQVEEDRKNDPACCYLLCSFALTLYGLSFTFSRLLSCCTMGHRQRCTTYLYYTLAAAYIYSHGVWMMDRAKNTYPCTRRSQGAAAMADMGMGGHGMGGGGGMAMAMAPAATQGGMGRRKRYMHMTFYWGKNSEILFTGWPGASGGMYTLALAAFFALAVLLEFLGSPRLQESSSLGGRRRATAAAAGAVHAVRVGLAYLLMLALMSFNVGVLLAAVAGHAVGFLAFRAGLCGGGYRKEDKLAPAACC
uniref:Copper transport protein n=1 Tax=Oryza punctata TaxID=4537 RepID=A0A0E0JP81_ORYPU